MSHLKKTSLVSQSYQVGYYLICYFILSSQSSKKKKRNSIGKSSYYVHSGGIKSCLFTLCVPLWGNRLPSSTYERSIGIYMVSFLLYHSVNGIMESFSQLLLLNFDMIQYLCWWNVIVVSFFHDSGRPNEKKQKHDLGTISLWDWIINYLKVFS